jgi:hypothetical protein
VDNKELIKNARKLYKIVRERGIQSRIDSRLKLDNKKELVELIKDKYKEQYNFIMSLDEKTREKLISELYCLYSDFYLLHVHLY